MSRHPDVRWGIRFVSPTRDTLRPVPMRTAIGIGLAILFVAACGVLDAQDLEPGHVRIRTSLSAPSALVGERVDLNVEVLTRTWFLAAPTFPDTLDVDGAVVLRPDAFAVNSSERIGGETFAVQARSFAIFPVSPGELVIPAFSVTLVVARDDASRSNPVTLSSEPRRLVAEVPEAARGLGLVPATPELRVSQEWSPTGSDWRIGDAVTRTVNQSIESSVAMVLSLPGGAAPDGVTAYAGRAVLENETNRGSLRGIRTDTVTYVLEEEGIFKIPHLVIHWWDLERGKLRRETLSGLQLDVIANPDLAAEHLTAPRDEDEEVSEPPAPKGRLPWQTILGVSVGLAGLWLVRNRVVEGLRRIGKLVFREPTEEALAWRRLRSALGSADAAGVLAALYSWLDWATEGVEITWRGAAERAGVNDVGAFESLEKAALGGDPAWSRADVRRTAGILRRRVVAAASRQERDSNLTPLNPDASRRSA